MSGDVFGNGMLLSDRIRLVAAYDHRHVFIDPDPDAAKGFAERKRLFELAGSSWDDYDRDAISAGGGVWPRSAKRIELSEQARAALGIDDAVLAPTEVIRAILRAPVDLLWNGGIGTVVKASTETDADALDRSSDAIRVDATELRCRVVGEGGNLGLTQRARIEFAREGGLVNADFIDNSAGVDCSDHEVNLKILLDLAERRGELDADGRDALLREVTDDVAEHVLYDSFLQAQILAQEVRGSASRMFAYEDLMAALEDEGLLRRDVEFLPTLGGDGRAPARGARPGAPGAGGAARLRQARLTGALLESSLPDDPWLERDLRGYFPPAGRRALRPPAGRAPAAARARGHDQRQPRRQRARARRSSRGWWPSGAPSRPTSCAPSASRARSPAPRRAGRPSSAWRASTARRSGAHGGRRRARRGDRALVPGERPRGRPRRGDRRRPRGLRAPASRCCPSSTRRARGARAAGRAARRAGRARRAGPRARLPAGAGLRARRHRRRAGGGRSVEDVGPAFVAARGPRCRSSWIEQQLDALPATTRMQRWALQAVRDDLWRARRELASSAP